MKIITVVSGGLDSVTLAYMLRSVGAELYLLSFDYGQKHVKELECATRCAADLHCEHTIINLKSLSPVLAGSALTSDDIAVPDGHYTSENMRVTIVPNRNAILLGIAYAAAINQKAGMVAIGVHAGDHAVYPDCRPPFISAFEEMEWAATGTRIELTAPFLMLSKADIVLMGHDLHVPFEHTWSCYKGGEKHCGTCGTCVERREAFKLAKVIDPTKYGEPHG